MPENPGMGRIERTKKCTCESTSSEQLFIQIKGRTVKSNKDNSKEVMPVEPKNCRLYFIKKVM